MSQAVIWTVPNLTKGVVDNSAGTFTFQTYDTSSSSYVTQWTMSLSTGAITVAAGQTLSKSLAVDGTSAFGMPVKNNSATKDVTGTTAGSFTWVMPEQGAGMKTVLVYFNGYENDTTTAQTVTYPVAFTQTPAIDNPSSVGGLSTDTTQLTINPDSTSKYTGWVKVWGL
jgi:hypothetical protein